MDMTALRPETTTAIGAIREALDLARHGTGNVHSKGGRDIVTDTDVSVEDHLRQSLTSSFSWPVIGEERGGQRPDDGPFWLVDPICGTRNFASGIPLFAVNAALVEDGRLALAVVGDGSTGDVLFAELGQGAWIADRDRAEPISVSVASLTVDFGGWPRAGGELERAAHQLGAVINADRWDVRCLATTLSLAYVASGRFAGCVLFAASDHVHFAAGALLVVEAGGRVSDTDGEPWTLSSTSLVCTASEELHQDLLAALR